MQIALTTGLSVFGLMLKAKTTGLEVTLKTKIGMKSWWMLVKAKCPLSLDIVGFTLPPPNGMPYLARAINIPIVQMHCGMLITMVCLALITFPHLVDGVVLMPSNSRALLPNAVRGWT